MAGQPLCPAIPTFFSLGGSVGETIAEKKAEDTTEGDFVTQGTAMDSIKAGQLVSTFLVGTGLARKGP